MQCILYKIYFWKVFHMNYNWICTPICTKILFLQKVGVTGDDMPKKWNFLQPESTLAELGIELMVSKSLQNISEMLRLLLFTLGIDQDVVNEDHDKLVQLWHEYGVHQVHEMCRSISESKRYNQILVQPVPGGEGSLRDIFQTDIDLMTT
jgi:hypothetical protein